MKKITLATVKAFAKKNADSLFIRWESAFDGQIDGSRNVDNPTFKPVTGKLDFSNAYTWGIGCYFVGSSRDYFNPYTGDGYVGIEVTNSCGNFILATKV